MQPAQIIFRELDRVPHWNGREGYWDTLGRWDVELLDRASVEGAILGRPVRGRLSGRILRINETPEGTYEWKTPGESHPSGNRHHSSRDWADVQDRIIKWAARRFRVEKGIA